jgi:hypothetical protein
MGNTRLNAIHGNGESNFEPAQSDSAPALAPPTTVERCFENPSERDWADLFGHIAAVAGSGGRITVAVSIETPGAQPPLQPVRIVTDPDAPALQPQDVDRLYPWRQKDLLRELNARLGRQALNSYDIQAVRRQHQLDERPEFVFNLPGAGRRYSPAVAEWMMGQFAGDPDFFKRARTADHEVMKLRRKKPR